MLTGGSTGNKWRRNRRLLTTPAFHFQILENFFDVFNKNAEILCEQLDEAIGNSKNIGEIVQSEIDVFPFLKRCTLDIICGNVSVTHRFYVLFSTSVVQHKMINAKNLFSFTQSWCWQKPQWGLKSTPSWKTRNILEMYTGTMKAIHHFVYCINFDCYNIITFSLRNC